MTHDHKAFPHITAAVTSMVVDNGGINRFRTLESMLEILDSCLGADGVYFDDLKKLDEWFASLSKDDLETAIGGEETDLLRIMATAPLMGGDMPGCDFVDNLYEACI